MKNSLITIALPCFNGERTIVDCLRSILAQTYTDWELLVMDDGSTDATLTLVQQFSDPRIQVIVDGQRLGRSARLNQATKLAKGEFYARMDADDIMFPQRLEKQVNFLKKNESVDLLGAGIISIGNDGTCYGYRQAPEQVSDPYAILKGEVLYHPTVMGRTLWFQNNPYEENYSYSEDYALWAKTADNLNIVNLQEPLLFYREKGSFTLEKYLFRIKETRKAILAYAKKTVGILPTLFLLTRLEIKKAIYLLCHLFGLWNHVLFLPNKSLHPTSKKKYSAILAHLTGKND